MIRKLLIIALLLSGANAFAQHTKANTGKAKENAPDTSKSKVIDYKEIGSPLPDFLIQTEDNKLYTQDDFNNGANLFVIMFNPTCSHCMDETRTLEKGDSVFKKSKIVFLGKPAVRSYLPKFITDLKTNDYPRMTIGIDSFNVNDKLYLYSLLPQINIYDKSRKLIKVFKGETPIDSLKSYIQ